MIRKALVFVVCVSGLLCMPGLASAQRAQALRRPVRNDRFPEMRQKTERLRAIAKEIRDSDDDGGRDKLADELEKLVAELFDFEVKQTEESIAKLQKDVQRKKQNREDLIKERIERVLDPNSAPGLAGNPTPRGEPYKIESVKKQEDGSSVAKVRINRAERRTRVESYTVQTPETRTRIVNGKEQTYTINVARPKTREVNYKVWVPGNEVHSVKIPKGKDKEEVVAAFVKKQSRR